VHFTLRQRTRLAALRTTGGILVLQALLWPDEVRAADFGALDDVAAPTDKELAMAETLVESMSEDFDPAEFTDEYQMELRALLDDAIERGGEKVFQVAEASTEGEDAEVLDLVAALQRSVEAAGGTQGTGERGSDTKKSSAKPAGRKAPAKAAAKKTSAKKAAPKKTPASESTAKRRDTRKRA
jgi:DNA end-binding protein Ku